MDDFFKTNIERKSCFLQKEHKNVLHALYKDAVESDAVKGFGFNPPYTQAMKYTKLKQELGEESKDILVICLHDLEQLGFIWNVMINEHKEAEYAIAYLGLKYLELNQ